MILTSPARRRRAVLGCAIALALIGGTLAAGPAAADPAEVPPPLACPSAYPLEDVTTATTGIGYTVVTGSTPQPFRVQVLGVLTDGIAPGKDLIMIKVSDLAGEHVVDQGGGIWAGMSGSPVDVGGRLLGAVSYGFTLAPSPIGGLTPAADMYDVLDRTSAGRAVRKPTPITLSAAQRQRFAAKAGTALPGATLHEISTPLGVGGVSSRRLAALRSAADRVGWNVTVHAAGRAGIAAATPTATPKPGGNFAAALTYGDVSFSGVGTTTAVCSNRALAFGHPLNLAGAVSYGANDADALAIIKDDTAGSFKMANVGAGFGTLDQDRLAAVRADLTATPKLSTIKTLVRNVESGKLRSGTTGVADASFLPVAAYYAALANLDVTFDEMGDGAATASWTIRGTRAGGKAFELKRANRFADLADITDAPASDLADALDQLINNDYEVLDVTSVEFASSVTTRFAQHSISKIAVSVNGGAYKTPRTLSVKPGDELSVRSTLLPYRGTTPVTSTSTLRVPKDAKGKIGYVAVDGGASVDDEHEIDIACLLLGVCDDDEPGSLSKLAESIRTAPRNDALLVELDLASPRGDDDPVPVASTRPLQPTTVVGSEIIEVEVR